MIMSLQKKKKKKAQFKVRIKGTDIVLVPLLPYLNNVWPRLMF